MKDFTNTHYAEKKNEQINQNKKERSEENLISTKRRRRKNKLNEKENYNIKK